MNEQVKIDSIFGITDNYSIFEVHTFNREVKRTKNLENSMIKHGYMPAYPLNVKKGRNGKLVIKDGHHRFEVAKKLGIPVAYSIGSDTASPTETVLATNLWKLEDFLTAYIGIGKTDYIDVFDYHRKTGLSISLCANLLGGYVAESGNFSVAFKKGTYKVNRDSYLSDVIYDFIKLFKELEIEISTDSKLINALSRIIIAKSCDTNNLKSKIIKNKQLIKKKSSMDEYTEMFADVYNYGERNRIPLKFNTDEKIKEMGKSNLIKNK